MGPTHGMVSLALFYKQYQLLPSAPVPRTGWIMALEVQAGFSSTDVCTDTKSDSWLHNLKAILTLWATVTIVCP